MVWLMVAATRRYSKILLNRTFRGDTGTLVTCNAVDLDVNAMKYGTSDPDRYDSDDENVDEECKVLPLWCDINMVETETVVDVLTQRGFHVLNFNNHVCNVPFRIKWQRPYQYESTTECERFLFNGWRLHEPANYRLPVRF
jgi:hypothetical protein